MRCGLKRRRSRPSKSTRPPWGRYRRVMTLKSVVLPAPFGPIRPPIWLCSTVSETSSNATIPPNRRATCSTERSAIRGRRSYDGRLLERGPLPLELLVPPGADAADHLALCLLRPRDRHTPDVDAGAERESEDAYERRPRMREWIVAARVLVARQGEAVPIDLDALGDGDLDGAEHPKRNDRDHV